MLLGNSWVLLRGAFGAPMGSSETPWELLASLGSSWGPLGTRPGGQENEKSQKRARHENQEKSESEKTSKYLTDKGSDAFSQIAEIAGPLGCSLEVLGSWEFLGAPWGSWVLFGHSWVLLGRSWAFWEVLGVPVEL